MGLGRTGVVILVVFLVLFVLICVLAVIYFAKDGGGDDLSDLSEILAVANNAKDTAVSAAFLAGQSDTKADTAQAAATEAGDTANANSLQLFTVEAKADAADGKAVAAQAGVDAGVLALDKIKYRKSQRARLVNNQSPGTNDPAHIFKCYGVTTNNAIPVESNYFILEPDRVYALSATVGYATFNVGWMGIQFKTTDQENTVSETVERYDPGTNQYDQIEITIPVVYYNTTGKSGNDLKVALWSTRETGQVVWKGETACAEVMNYN